MNLRLFAILIIVPFGALTAAAIGLDENGFQDAIFHNFTSFQIWLDLVIAMVFWCAWILRDAKSSGFVRWIWVIGALIFGAFVPLIYMILYQRWPASPSASAQTAADEEAPRTIAMAAFALLAVITIAAVAVDGTDVPGAVMRTWSNIQIWVDLVIMIVFWLAWMIQDARQSGRNPWGWVVFALILGSFSPLLYTILYRRWPASHPVTTS